MSAGSVHPGPTDRETRRADQAVQQFVGFRLGDGLYALPITKIREIILMKPITRLPQVAEAIEGLINLRGLVIPIINLRKRFGLPARPFDDETRTIVVTVHDRTVGCIVDEVTQVLRINGDQIQGVPVSVATSARRYIAGLAKLDDALLIILDIDQLLGSEESELDPAALATLATKAHPDPQSEGVV
jgi:purine-binding chemotaxis protein CheW